MKTTKTEMMKNVVCDRSKLIDNNTVEYWRGKTKIIRLHLTDILTFKNNLVVYNSGGWRTVTTKKRMNDYGNANIYQDKSIWHIWTGSYYNDENRRESVFFDGIKVRNNGVIVKPKKDDKKVRSLLKLINRYCKALKDLEALPLPGNGDCWNCLMFDQGLKVGEKSTSKDHLLSHLKEKYIHGSLIFNALRWTGYNNPSLIFQMDVRDSIVRCVKRYFKANLGIAA